MTEDNTFHLFNTKTMSGIHPGSRTARVHMVRLQTIGAPQEPQTWVRVLWPEETEGCAVYRHKDGGQWEDQPFLSLSGATSAQMMSTLADALGQEGQRPLVCGFCLWWQPIAEAANEDGIPLGRCTWAGGSPATSPSTGQEQGFLAMDCPHWDIGEQLPAVSQTQPDLAAAPKSSGWWSALKERLTGNSRPTGVDVSAVDIVNLAERSGVGAGTERCLACHGRIANLGALSVATERDDKRTLSVWRCRRCHTFYLNDWIDRWERLDSLETEENYYRIAPYEAITLLALFRERPGSEHPKDRHSRTEQRAQMDAFLANRPRLLHQIKLGR